MWNNKYRLMIMTASIGCGHNQAAKVIEKKLLEKDDRIQIEILDIIDIFPPAIGQFIKNTYIKIIDRTPNWYKLLYKITERLNRADKVNSIFLYKHIKKTYRLIEEFNPHIILFTNPLPLILVSYLKRKNKITSYTATIITDYTAHRVWLDPSINTYFVGSSILKGQMVKRGINSLKIQVTGIPVDEKFIRPINRNRKMAELGLDINLPTILIMGGGLGLGSIEEILNTTNQINRPLQLLVVAGKNQDLEKRLRFKAYNPKHRVRIFGFSNNIYELMACSQLLVSKAGGLTMTEAVNKKLPILVYDPIPGQEVKNAQYFSHLGAARYLKGLEDVRISIEELLYEEAYKRYKMVKSCSKICKPEAAEDIAQFILEKLSRMNTSYEKAPMIR